jgi:hypothetical protein
MTAKSRRPQWIGHIDRLDVTKHLGRPRITWEDDIKTDLMVTGCEDRRWIELAQDRVQWRTSVRADSKHTSSSVLVN